MVNTKFDMLSGPHCNECTIGMFSVFPLDLSLGLFIFTR